MNGAGIGTVRVHLRADKLIRRAQFQALSALYAAAAGDLLRDTPLVPIGATTSSTEEKTIPFVWSAVRENRHLEDGLKSARPCTLFNSSFRLMPKTSHTYSFTDFHVGTDKRIYFG